MRTHVAGMVCALALVLAPAAGAGQKPELLILSSNLLEFNSTVVGSTTQHNTSPALASIIRAHCQ